jgi:hypothetical protein
MRVLALEDTVSKWFTADGTALELLQQQLSNLFRVHRSHVLGISRFVAFACSLGYDMFSMDRSIHVVTVLPNGSTQSTTGQAKVTFFSEVGYP